MAKRFFFVCLGFLCLAIAYHLGARSADAQSNTGDRVKLIASNGETAWVVSESDEVYMISGKAAPSVSHGAGWAKFRLGVLR